MYTIILLYVHFLPDAALKELRLLHYSSKICNVRWYRFQHQKSTIRLFKPFFGYKLVSMPWLCPRSCGITTQKNALRHSPITPRFSRQNPLPANPPPPPHILLTPEFLFTWKNVSCILYFSIDYRKDHVNRELLSQRRWPDKWGFLANEYHRVSMFCRAPCTSLCRGTENIK